MADISMCPGYECPMKETCYRFTATPRERWQSYMTITPLKLSDDDVPYCEHFWSNKDYE